MLDISAVIVTRGDIDLTPILDSIPFDDIVVWDNSKEKHDLKVLGRYGAISRAKHDLIYTQDDDCIVPILDLIDAWDGNLKSILCNMPSDHGEYTDSALIGWGSLFGRDLPVKAFAKYSEFYSPLEDNYIFTRTCDVIFTTLTPFTRVDLGHQSFDYAYGPDRMYNQSNHNEERQMILEKARYVRDFPHPWRDYD